MKVKKRVPLGKGSDVSALFSRFRSTNHHDLQLSTWESASDEHSRQATHSRQPAKSSISRKLIGGCAEFEVFHALCIKHKHNSVYGEISIASFEGETLKTFNWPKIKHEVIST